MQVGAQAVTLFQASNTNNTLGFIDPGYVNAVATTLPFRGVQIGGVQMLQLVGYTNLPAGVIATVASAVDESPSPNPEPSTWGLLAIGFLGLRFAAGRNA